MTLEKQRDELAAEFMHEQIMEGLRKQRQATFAQAFAEGFNAAYELTQAREAKLVEALKEAVEYLEPRLANKFGSRGLTIVLPRLRQVLAELNQDATGEK